MNKRYAHKRQQVILYLSERGEKKVRPWCASCHLSQVPMFHATLRAHPITAIQFSITVRQTVQLTPDQPWKVTSTSSRILPRSPDWQLINLLWLQSLLLSDRAWARAEDSPMPGCVHPRWSTCLDQTLSTGRGQDGKDQKRGVLGISTGNKTKQITSCQGVSLLSGRANVCNQALRARPLNETGHE